MTRHFDFESSDNHDESYSISQESGLVQRKLLGRFALAGGVLATSVLAGLGIINWDQDKTEMRHNNAMEKVLVSFGWAPETFEVKNGGSELVLKCANPDTEDQRSITILNDEASPELLAELFIDTRDRKGRLFTTYTESINLVEDQTRIGQMMSKVCQK